VYALNLNRSPEKPLILGVGRSCQTGRRPCRRRAKDECQLSPRGLRQHRVAQRYASNQASDERALGKTQGKHPSMTTNVKRGVQMAASQVMGIGTPPQAVSDEVG